MQLSFTTLGCPDWTLDTIIANASASGFDAIDFRGLNGEMYIYRLPEFSDRAAETKSRIEAAGLKVSCFSSSVHAFSRENLEKHQEEVRSYSRLCEQFGTRYIRVFGGKIGDTGREEAIETLARHLNALGGIAEAHGATVLLETHDDWMNSAHVKAVLEQVESKAVGVLWDVHHPYRVLGEAPETTWANLGRWIEYTHVKDSKVTGDAGEFSYCLIGEGDVPLPRICSLLHNNGYKGCYTLEWEKKWHPELAEADVAFPHYVQFMRRLGKELNA